MVGLSAVFAAAQPVRLAPTLEKSRTLTYEISRTLSVDQTTPPVATAGGGGAPTTSHSESHLDMVLRLDVGSVRADGTTEVGVEIQSLKFRIDDAGAVKSFTHPPEEPPRADPGKPAAEDADQAKPDPDKPAEAPPLDDKPAEALDLIGSAFANSSIRVVINREGGVSDIVGIDGVAAAVEAAKKTDRSVSRVTIESFGPSALRQVLLPIFVPAAPEPASRLFAAGDTWTVRRTSDLGSVGSVVIDEGWTLSPGGNGDEPGTVSASGITRVTANEPRGIVSASPTLKIDSSTGTHDLVWDVTRGSLVKFSHGLEMSLTFTLGDLSVTQKQVSSLLISRP